MILIKLIPRLSLFILPIALFGQRNLIKSNTYEFASSILVSSGAGSSFFLRTNQYGEIPNSSFNFQAKAGVYHNFDSLMNIHGHIQKADMGYGASVLVNLGAESQLILPELYVKGRLGFAEAYIGRRKEIVGLVDSSLSSGSFVWSGNALPIPKVQISTHGYVPILGKNLIAINASYAHGWLGSTDSVKHYFLHQKSFYARIGRPSWKIRFQFGFNHQVQWGGAPAKPFVDKRTNQLIEKYSTDFSTYIKIVTGKSLNANMASETVPNGMPSNEALNRAGNHLGTLDFAAEFYISRAKILIYKQSYYEDGSLYYLSNIEDGLHGLSIRPVWRREVYPKIKGICVEFLNTRDQGGNYGSGATIPELRGVDNYFNNGIYEDGWAYRRNVIGTPYIIANKDLKPNIRSKGVPDYYFRNNRVRAFYLAFSGDLNPKIAGLFRYVSSLNLGNYSAVLNKLHQSSFQLQASYAAKPTTQFYFNLAFDAGQLFKDRAGIQLGFRKLFR